MRQSREWSRFALKAFVLVTRGRTGLDRAANKGPLKLFRAFVDAPRTGGLIPTVRVTATSENAFRHDVRHESSKG